MERGAPEVASSGRLTGVVFSPARHNRLRIQSDLPPIASGSAPNPSSQIRLAVNSPTSKDIRPPYGPFQPPAGRSVSEMSISVLAKTQLVLPIRFR